MITTIRIKLKACFEEFGLKLTDEQFEAVCAAVDDLCTEAVDEYKMDDTCDG